MLAIILTAPPHASQIEISISPKAPTFGEYSFQALCLYALGCRSSRRDDLRVRSHLFYCFPGACCPCRVLPVSPVPTGHEGTMFAIGTVRRSGEHAMEACQIASRSGDQGRQACNKVQWFEDDMSGAIPKAFAAAKAFAALMGWTPLMGQAFSIGCF